MHSRGEVRSFLQSAAHYWLDRYHFDGLRFDAISRILYWQGDERRGVNGSGVAFLRTMNAGLQRLHPGCILAAEDSTNYSGVTRPAAQGGLGFTCKWDLGWMHDTLSFMQTGPRIPARKLPQADLFDAVLPQRALPAAALPRPRSCTGKATVLQKMPRRIRRQVPAGAGAVYVHDDPPGQKAQLYGRRVRPAARMGRKARAGHGTCAATRCTTAFTIIWPR